MEKKYNHKIAESEPINQNLFENNELSPSFTCLLPPPNITGKLHLGHMWNCTIQDILLRFNYLQEKNPNWLIGLDHAGIATQVKVEKDLTSQIANFNPSDYSRDWLKEKGNQWFEENKQLIIKQWEKMGLLMNLKQITYTLAPEFNKLVIHAFVKLYQDGLIYKGKKMINWDVKLQTAVSDLEVIHKTEKSKLYYLKYYLAENPKEYLTVATSRPETVFADSCLFVNPHDNRYTKYIGKQVINPTNQKKIPILTDESVLIDFGTGVLKCTPAHDFSDYELGIKYKLACETCLDPKGYLNELAGKYQGLDRFMGRKKLIQDLQESGICSQIEIYETNLGYSQRSNTIIEPYLSTQWFLNYREWIKKIEQQQKKTFAELLTEMEFIPAEYNYRLLQWKTDLKDWCLSRQLWWGHQIPAWYHKETGEIYVAENPPTDAANWEREKMVLDTWFSSGLAPVFHSGYVQKKENLKLPINLLVTAYDILFFWVFKMICFNYYFTEKKPFNHVLIHGLIRDADGNKMSKSLGNVIAPEDLMEKYGTDAIRLTFVSSQSQDQDIKIQDNKLKGNWRFLDKIWNISRCLEGLKNEHNIQAEELNEFNIKWLEKDYLNCYFLLNFSNLASSYNSSLNQLKFSETINNLKRFIVSDSGDELTRKLIALEVENYEDKIDFGNDYLEILKLTKDKNSVKTGLILFKCILRLLNPFIPFTSQYLYKQLYSNSLLLSQRDNKLLKELVNLKKTEEVFLNIQQNSKIMWLLFYSMLREIRIFKEKYAFKENLIVWLILLPMSRISEKGKESYYLISDENYIREIKEKFDFLLRKLVNTELNAIILYDLKRVNEYEENKKKIEKERSVSSWEEELFLGPGRLEFFLPSNFFSQLKRENEKTQASKIKAEKLFLEKEIARCNNFLNNKNFVNKAPEELVKKEKEKLSKLQIRYEELSSK